MMALTIQNLQQLCNIARAAFETQHVIIGGGAPRDTLSGVEVKDIDVFVKIEDGEWDDPLVFKNRAEYFAAILGGRPEFREPVDMEGYEALFDICEFLPQGPFAGFPVVQVVAVGVNPIDDVHEYDFGLSQVFVTPAGVFFTEAAAQDRATKTITYIDRGRSDAANLRSAQRLERLKVKYPDWAFANCERFEKVEATPDDVFA